MAIPKLPATLYVRTEPSDEDDYVLLADDECGGLIEGNGPTTIGVYRLVETVVATKSVVVQPQHARKARR